jgi:diguanylate cyclase (GGDEF)-like protein
MSKEEARRTILIVDDAPANIQALGSLLKDEYRILVARHGEKALQIAREDSPPDLILLDIQMPDMDGYEVCRRLKSESPLNRIPVIFVTAKSGADEEELGFSLGAVDYISKPFHPAVVRARVRNQMNLKIRTDLLEELSLVDGLTGIFNRRYFDEHFEEEKNRALRREEPLSVIMMDIDNFKAYNDNYGHGAGDECLQQVARALRSNLSRSGDFVARYGGEEFVALLPGMGGTGVMTVAERLRHGVESLKISHAYSPTAKVVTISLGVASSEAGASEEDRSQLLKRADQALYRSKREGRNRSTFLENLENLSQGEGP